VLLGTLPAEKGIILYPHSQTHKYDHTQITLLTENPLPICRRKIWSYWTTTSAHSVSLLLSESTSA